MEDQPLVVDQLLNAPVPKVWKALTDKEEMKNWYFQLEEFKAQVGFSFSFSAGPPERQYLHLCEVKEVIPEKKLTYSWRYDGYPGNSFVTFELFEQGSKTLLRLTHTALETLPQENTDFARNNFQQGWDEIVRTSLRNYVEKEGL